MAIRIPRRDVHMRKPMHVHVQQRLRHRQRDGSAEDGLLVWRQDKVTRRRAKAAPSARDAHALLAVFAVAAFLELTESGSVSLEQSPPQHAW